jgi:hypothetical protein
LKEDTAAKNQQPSDTKSGVMVSGGDNYFFKRLFIHVPNSLAAVHNVMDRLRWLAFVILHNWSMPQRKNTGSERCMV